jgi:hypothetical protein
MILIKTDIVIAKSGDHTIYLIPTDDGSFTSFLITPPTSDPEVLTIMEITGEISSLAIPG